MPIDRNVGDWEGTFHEALTRVVAPHGSADTPAGVLLPVIPTRTEWEAYLTSVKTDWHRWRSTLGQYPASLLVLYAGIAFYEYADGTFWPQFAASVDTSPLTPNDQRDINNTFSAAAAHFGLRSRLRVRGTDFVGSAVHYIGIPLSLWDDFLTVCDWALWQSRWSELSDGEWKDAATRRAGGKARLKHFLIDYRHTATQLITEMLAARQVLSEDATLSTQDISQASILRSEYFDEVPETAEFLRPKDPGSLLQNRARLVWNHHRRQISLLLPAVSNDKLPAKWALGTHTQNAATTPDALVVNADAFTDPLLLRLRSANGDDLQRIRGIGPWALFDLEGGNNLVNVARDHLPLKSYSLVSSHPLQLSSEGFDHTDHPPNERLTLTDGTSCFVTGLFPTGKYAELHIDGASGLRGTLRFRPRARLDTRFFLGWGRNAAYSFREPDGMIGLDHLPVLCVSIPRAYFRDSAAELQRLFHVTIDNRDAAGFWKHLRTDDNGEFWQWRWSKTPLLEFRGTTRRLTSLSALADAFRSQSLIGIHKFAIRAPGHMVERDFTVHIVGRSDTTIDLCWKNLPGALLPLFLLCGREHGLRWEELLLAREVLAPQEELSHYMFRRYAKYCVLQQHGLRWRLDQSRADWLSTSEAHCELAFCGDPSILWSLYRQMVKRSVKLPTIDVVAKRGELPYMKMIWPSEQRAEIQRYLAAKNVVRGLE
jgi:hypothetical protein